MLHIGDIVFHSDFLFEIPLLFIGYICEDNVYTGLGRFLAPDGSLYETFTIEPHCIMLPKKKGESNVSID